MTEEVSQVPMGWSKLARNMIAMLVTAVSASDGLIESICAVEHHAHMGDGGGIPIADGLVESICAVEHA